MRERQETRGSGPQGFTQQVRTFRVDRYDEAGDRLPPIPVEMRGESFWGVVSEGDWVAIPEDWSGDRTVFAARVANLTTGGEFGVTAAVRKGVLFQALAVVFFVGAFVTVVLRVASLAAASASGHPFASGGLNTALYTVLPVCFVGFIVCAVLAMARHGVWQWKTGRGTSSGAQPRTRR